MSLPPDRETTYLDGHIINTEGALITIKLKGTGSDKFAHLSPPSLLTVEKHAVIGAADVEAGDTGIEVLHSWIKKQPWFGYLPSVAGDEQDEFEVSAGAAGILRDAEQKARLKDALDKINPPQLTHGAHTLGAAFNGACNSLVQTAMKLSDNDRRLAAALLNAAAEKWGQ